MCDYIKIFRRYPEFHDILNNRFNSNLDFILFSNYVRFLKTSCKCKNKFDVMNLLITSRF